jgi:anti-sigma B factor antagonist
MNNTEYNYSILKDNSEFAVIKLSESVLGGNDALQFTNLLEEIDDSVAKYVIIDAGAVQMMNSTGIGMLVNAHSNLTKKGLTMMIINVPNKIMKLFVMTHLDKVFKICDNLESAVLFSKN